MAAKRLDERLRPVEGADYEIEGIPQTLEGAQDMWVRDKYDFQKWAVESAGGFVTARKSGDGGVDGRIYFDVPGKNVDISVMRELRGVLDDDAARSQG